MSDVEVGIRPAVNDDRSYIKDCWLKSFQRDSSWTTHLDPELFRRSHRTLVERLMKAATVLVAYDPENPRVILGFVCGDNYPVAPVVHYVYTAAYVRRWGIAKLLVSKLGWSEGRPLMHSHHTRYVGYIGQRHLLVYNPYLMFEEFRSLIDGKTTPRQDARLIKYTPERGPLPKYAPRAKGGD